MSHSTSKTTIAVIVIAVILAAYVLGILDPLIEWAREASTLEGQTQGMIEQILN